MDKKEPVSDIDVTDYDEYQVAKKICLDSNNVAYSNDCNKSVSDNSLHLGSLYSPKLTSGSIEYDQTSEVTPSNFHHLHTDITSESLNVSSVSLSNVFHQTSNKTTGYELPIMEESDAIEVKLLKNGNLSKGDNIQTVPTSSDQGILTSTNDYSKNDVINLKTDSFNVRFLKSGTTTTGYKPDVEEEGESIEEKALKYRNECCALKKRKSAGDDSPMANSRNNSLKLADNIPCDNIKTVCSNALMNSSISLISFDPSEKVNDKSDSVHIETECDNLNIIGPKCHVNKELNVEKNRSECRKGNLEMKLALLNLSSKDGDEGMNEQKTNFIDLATINNDDSNKSINASSFSASKSENSLDFLNKKSDVEQASNNFSSNFIPNLLNKSKSDNTAQNNSINVYVSPIKTELVPSGKVIKDIKNKLDSNEDNGNSVIFTDDHSILLKENDHNLDSKNEICMGNSKNNSLNISTISLNGLFYYSKDTTLTINNAENVSLNKSPVSPIENTSINIKDDTNTIEENIQCEKNVTIDYSSNENNDHSILFKENYLNLDSNNETCMGNSKNNSLNISTISLNGLFSNSKDTTLTINNAENVSLNKSPVSPIANTSINIKDDTNTIEENTQCEKNVTSDYSSNENNDHSILLKENYHNLDSKNETCMGNSKNNSINTSTISLNGLCSDSKDTTLTINNAENVSLNKSPVSPIENTSINIQDYTNSIEENIQCEKNVTIDYSSNENNDHSILLKENYLNLDSKNETCMGNSKNNSLNISTISLNGLFSNSKDTTLTINNAENVSLNKSPVSPIANTSINIKDDTNSIEENTLRGKNIQSAFHPNEESCSNFYEEFSNNISSDKLDKISGKSENDSLNAILESPDSQLSLPIPVITVDNYKEIDLVDKEVQDSCSLLPSINISDGIPSLILDTNQEHELKYSSIDVSSGSLLASSQAIQDLSDTQNINSENEDVLMFKINESNYDNQENTVNKPSEVETINDSSNVCSTSQTALFDHSKINTTDIVNDGRDFIDEIPQCEKLNSSVLLQKNLMDTSQMNEELSSDQTMNCSLNASLIPSVSLLYQSSSDSDSMEPMDLNDEVVPRVLESNLINEIVDADVSKKRVSIEAKGLKDISERSPAYKKRKSNSLLACDSSICLQFTDKTIGESKHESVSISSIIPLSSLNKSRNNTGIDLNESVTFQTNAIDKLIVKIDCKNDSIHEVSSTNTVSSPNVSIDGEKNYQSRMLPTNNSDLTVNNGQKVDSSFVESIENESTNASNISLNDLFSHFTDISIHENIEHKITNSESKVVGLEKVLNSTENIECVNQEHANVYKVVIPEIKIKNANNEQSLSMCIDNNKIIPSHSSSINVSIGFMDETCIDNSNLADVSSKHILKLNTESREKKIDVLSFNDENSIKSINKSEDILDFTCKTERLADNTILGEETVNFCQSIMIKEGQKVMSEKSEILQRLDSSCKIVNEFLSTSQNVSIQLLQQEVSGTALDYTFSEIEEEPKNRSDMSNFKDVLTELSNYPENTSSNQINMSHSYVISKLVDTITSETMSCELTESEKDETVVISDETLELTTSNISSFLTNDNHTAKEMGFFKENLIKVMEFLKNENHSIEFNKLEHEKEKNQLLLKIKNLESKIIVNDTKDNALSTKTVNPDHSYTNYKEFNTKEHLSELPILTLKGLSENILLIDLLKEINISVDDLITPVNQVQDKYVVPQKNLIKLTIWILDKFKNNLGQSKYEELLAEVIRKTSDIEILSKKLMDTKLCKETLETQLFESQQSQEYIDQLKAENNEMKLTCEKYREWHVEKEMNQNILDQLYKETEHLQKENSDLRIKFEESHKFLLASEDKSYELEQINKKISEELEIKSSELSLLFTAQNQLEDEVKKLKEKAICDDELSQKLLNFNDLNEKYSKVISDFELLKNTYTKAEKEIDLLKEAKIIVENELASSKSKFDLNTENLDKIKADNEEIISKYNLIEKEYSEEKRGFKEIQNLYANLKIKHEELITEESEKSNQVERLNNKLLEANMGQEVLKKKLTFSENSLDDLKEKLSLATKEIVLLANSKEQTQSNVDKISTTCENYKRRFEEKDKNFSELDGMNNILKNEISSLKLVLEESKNRLQQLQTEIDKMKISDQETKKSSINSKYEYDKLESVHTQICDELHLKTDELTSLMAVNTILEVEIENLRNHNNTINNDILQKQSEFNSLNEKYNEVNSNFEQLKYTYKCIDNEIVQIKEQNVSLEYELASTKSILDNKVEELNKIKADYEVCSRKYDIAEKGVMEKTLLVEEMKTVYDNLNIKHNELVAEDNNKAVVIESITKQLLASENSQEDLRSQLSASQKNDDDLKEKLLSAEEKVDKLNELNKNLKIKIGDISMTSEEYKKCLGDKEVNCNQLEETNSLLICEITSLKSILDQSKNIEEKLKNEIEELKISNTDHKNLLLESNGKYLQLECTQKQNSELLDVKTIECCSLIASKKDLEDEIDNLSKNNSAKLEELRRNNNHLETKYNSCNNELSLKLLEFGHLSDKYTEVLSNFEEHKRIYTFTEDEISKLKEDKSFVENELTETKSQLDSNLLELNKIKADYDEIITKCQLVAKEYFEEKQVFEETKNLYENLKLKNEELVAEGINKTLVIESLTKKLSEAETSQEGLEAQLTTTQTIVDHLREKLSLVEEDISSLNFKDKQTQSDLNKLNIENDVLKVNIVEISTTCEQYKKSFEEKEKHCHELKELDIISNNKINSLTLNVDELKNTIEQLTIEYEQLKIESEASLSESLGKYNKLEIAVKKISEELELKNNELSSLTSTKQQLEDEIDNLTKNNSSINEKLQLLHDDHTALENKLFHICSELDEKTKECDFNLSNYLEKYKFLELDYDKIMNELNLIKKTNETLKSECDENYKLYKNKSEEVEKLQKENEEFRKDLLKSEKEHQNTLNSLRNSQVKINNIEKEIIKNKTQFDSVLAEKNSFESQNTFLLKTTNELRSHIEVLNHKVLENQNCKIQHAELKKSYDDTTNKHRNLEKQLMEFYNIQRENEVLKSSVEGRDSMYNTLVADNNILKQKFISQSNELRNLSGEVLALFPGSESLSDTMKSIREKLEAFRKIEDDLEEEKTKCVNLDEECEILNHDLKFKDKVIGDMYDDHTAKMKEMKEQLKKEENLHQKIFLENSSLKDKIKHLDEELSKLKILTQVKCSSCIELKNTLRQMKIDLADNILNVTSLQQQLEESETKHKQKIHEYRKKVSSLQEELGTALNKLEETKHTPDCTDAFVQTEYPPMQICGQSGIIQSHKIKEQEERIKKIEKENKCLKQVCQIRLNNIQELKKQLEVDCKAPKTQRNVLEEVQNHPT